MKKLNPALDLVSALSYHSVFDCPDCIISNIPGNSESVVRTMLAETRGAYNPSIKAHCLEDSSAFSANRLISYSIPKLLLLRCPIKRLINNYEHICIIRKGHFSPRYVSQFLDNAFFSFHDIVSGFALARDLTLKNAKHEIDLYFAPQADYVAFSGYDFVIDCDAGGLNGLESILLGLGFEESIISKAIFNESLLMGARRATVPYASYMSHDEINAIFVQKKMLPSYESYIDAILIGDIYQAYQKDFLLVSQIGLHQESRLYDYLHGKL